jgi:hypothetical protein
MYRLWESLHRQSASHVDFREQTRCKERPDKAPFLSGVQLGATPSKQGSALSSVSFCIISHAKARMCMYVLCAYAYAYAEIALPVAALRYGTVVMRRKRDNMGIHMEINSNS